MTIILLPSIRFSASNANVASKLESFGNLDRSRANVACSKSDAAFELSSFVIS